MDANAESKTIIAVAERVRQKIKRMEELAQELTLMIDSVETMARRVELASRPTARDEAHE